MSKLFAKQHLGFVLTWLVSILILTDFLLPATAFQSTVDHVKQEKQQYYNAAGNYHFSYRVHTEQGSFPVSESLGLNLHTCDTLDFGRSPIFGEVNWVQSANYGGVRRHSFRWATGLVLPLAISLILLLAYRNSWKAETLVFVLQVLLIADLVYLIK